MKHFSPQPSLTSSSWVQSRDKPLYLHAGCTRDLNCSHQLCPQPSSSVSLAFSVGYLESAVGGASLLSRIP